MTSIECKCRRKWSTVFPLLGDQPSDYRTSSGALRFPVDELLPKSMVEELLSIRIEQAFRG